MFDKDGPLILNALYGTLYTWAMTAAGAVLAFVFRKPYRKVLDASLGFAAGVMTAASFWSLIAPAIEMAEDSGDYGEFSFVPVAIGFTLGAFFVWGTDWGISRMESKYQNIYDVTDGDHFVNSGQLGAEPRMVSSSQVETENKDVLKAVEEGEQNRASAISPKHKDKKISKISKIFHKLYKNQKYSRLMLLVIAMTVHNIPEGLAVGVAFGAAGKSDSATFKSARILALGMGFQNLPEGLAVSLPLRSFGMPSWKAFMWGQFSGMVEPIFGVLGCWAVTLAEPVLPYALAFAAGAMIWVVFDDIVPEAQSEGNGKIASVGSVVGFVVMMALDVALG